MRSSLFPLILMLGTLSNCAVAGVAAPSEAPPETLPYIFHVESRWCVTAEQAREDALQQARAHLQAYLQTLRPPVEVVPTIEQIQQHMLRSSFTTEPKHFPPPIDEKMMKVALEIELSPDDLRQLRAQDRAFWGTKLFAGMFALLAVVTLFFRLDEWTRGYLTSWLGLAGLVLFLSFIGLLIGVS